MNNILNKLRFVSGYCSKRRAWKSAQFPYRWKTTSVALPSQSIVTVNLCEKLKCTEIVAKNIYDSCPTLQSIDAIQNDSLQMLRTKLSLLSIIENPELITMELGNRINSFITFIYILIKFSDPSNNLSICFRCIGTEN